MEYEHHRDGSITEVPPRVLDCGHPNGPGLSHIGYEWSSEHRRRVRTYRCDVCGCVTYIG